MMESSSNTKTTRYSAEFLLSQKPTSKEASSSRFEALRSIVPKAQQSWRMKGRRQPTSASSSSDSSPQTSLGPTSYPQRPSFRRPTEMRRVSSPAEYLKLNPDRIRSAPATDALPYQRQYKFLTALQQITEKALFAFCQTHLPQYLEENYIDCWEAGEINVYRPALVESFDTLKGQGVLKLSANSGTGNGNGKAKKGGQEPAQSTSNKLATSVHDVDRMLRKIEKMRNVVVHRKNVGLGELRRYSEDVESVLELLGNKDGVWKLWEERQDIEDLAEKLGIKAEERRSSVDSTSTDDSTAVTTEESGDDY